MEKASQTKTECMDGWKMHGKTPGYYLLAKNVLVFCLVVKDVSGKSFGRVWQFAWAWKCTHTHTRAECTCAPRCRALSRALVRL